MTRTSRHFSFDPLPLCIGVGLYTYKNEELEIPYQSKHPNKEMTRGLTE
jgi:hypothetical protein